MYNEFLLDRNLHPVNRGEIDGVVPIEMINGSCGDKLKIYLKIEGGKVIDGAFSGVGCAISQASADMFLSAVRGKSLDEISEMKDIFEKMLLSNASEEELEKLGEAKALECVSKMPARAKCAKLAWGSVDKI